MQRLICTPITKKELDFLLDLLLRYSYSGLSSEVQLLHTQVTQTLQEWAGRLQDGKTRLIVFMENMED